MMVMMMMMMRMMMMMMMMMDDNDNQLRPQFPEASEVKIVGGTWTKYRFKHQPDRDMLQGNHGISRNGARR